MASLYEIEAAMLDCSDTETGEVIDIERLSQLEKQVLINHGCRRVESSCREASIPPLSGQRRHHVHEALSFQSVPGRTNH